MDSQAHVQGIRREDGFTSTPKLMFRREGQETNGWIHRHSPTYVQERRRGDKWVDSQALRNPYSGEKDT